MNQQDFDRLKAKLGSDFEILNESTEDNDKYFIVKMKKDIWEGVEYVECINSSYLEIWTVGKIYKLHKPIEDSLLPITDNKGEKRHVCNFTEEFIKIGNNCFKPSTEQAYIDQLKKEAFDKWDGQLHSERIDDSNLEGGRIEFRYDTNKANPFKYRKDTDTLYWIGIPIYQAGKWAKKLPKRIEVELVNLPSVDINSKIINFDFKLSETSIQLNYSKFLKDLTNYVEKYLNNEL